MTARQQEVAQAFLIHKTHKATAGALGISRERVRQIMLVAARTDKAIATIIAQSKRTYWKNKNCLICKRSLKELQQARIGVCAACYRYEKKKEHPKKHITLRYILRSKQCLICTIPFSRNHWYSTIAPGDLCRRCFSKTESFKKNQRTYYLRKKAAQA